MAEDVNIEHSDVQRFTEKLDAWGESLPDSEKGMLQLLLSRAEAGGASADASQAHDVATGASPGETAAGVLKPLVEKGATAKFAVTPNARCTWSTWSRGTPPI